MRLSSSPSVRRRSAVAVGALFAALAIGACSAGRPAGQPPAMPQSNAFHHADSDCRQVAARETETITPQTQASKVAITIYWRCMSAKGFPPPGAATPAAAPAPNAAPAR
jgi:hypothetical protein